MDPDERLDPQTEDLLWQLSELPPRSRGTRPRAPIHDHLLQRYRRGEMTRDERRSLEMRLADDPEAQERLAEIAARDAPPRSASRRDR